MSDLSNDTSEQATQHVNELIAMPDEMLRKIFSDAKAAASEADATERDRENAGIVMSRVATALDEKRRRTSG